MGDLGDLARLTKWSRKLGAGFVLVNPLNAVAPIGEQQPSPYYPASRRLPQSDLSASRRRSETGGSNEAVRTSGSGRTSVERRPDDRSQRGLENQAGRPSK